MSARLFSCRPALNDRIELAKFEKLRSGDIQACVRLTGSNHEEDMAKNADYKKTYPISWEQLHRDCKALSWRLLDREYFKGIIAITRGGMVPAAIIARELDIHLVDTICISSYDWKDKKGDAEMLKKFDGNGEGWLLIDDLVDTGRTAKVVREMVPKAHFATVYAKPAGRPLVDTYVTEVSQDTWILFPWDTESQFATPLVGRER